MDLFMQQVLNGLTLGSIYGLVALGLTLVYGILHVPNFAHGALYMVGAYVSYVIMVDFGANYWLAMLGAAGAVALLAVLCERLVFNPLRDAPPIHDKIAAIGIMLFLEALVQMHWGAEFRRMPTPYTGIVEFAGLTLPAQRILIIVGAFSLMAVLHLFLKKTLTGSTIVAMAQNRVIGREGSLPWRLSDDLKWFRKVTTGKPVIMGRKTFDSIGKALPGRDNIVITRNKDFAAPDVTVATSLEDAISIAEAFALSRTAGEICIIGGGTVYEEALPLVTKIYLTEVAANIEGDTLFPDLARPQWTEEAVGKITKNDRNEQDARILILTRSDPG